MASHLSAPTSLNPCRIALRLLYPPVCPTPRQRHRDGGRVRPLHVDGGAAASAYQGSMCREQGHRLQGQACSAIHLPIPLQHRSLAHLLLLTARAFLSPFLPRNATDVWRVPCTRKCPYCYLHHRPRKRITCRILLLRRGYHAAQSCADTSPTLGGPQSIAQRSLAYGLARGRQQHTRRCPRAPRRLALPALGGPESRAPTVSRSHHHP
mmetsp:Transcript_53685/g.78659  ORF Transcript_53685/g.78659 Transcript_53685/m.78659 type:complete len:209 (-) Transcript_53685:126-752(-)